MQLITILDIFGEPSPHGYNLKSGGWCLYPPTDEEPVPVRFAIVRWKRKRRQVVINMRYILKIEDIPSVMKTRMKGE